MNSRSGAKKKIVITGATRGLGLALTLLTSNDPTFEVTCVVRDPDHLAGLERLKQQVQVLACDYARIEDVLHFDEFARMSLSMYAHAYLINNVADFRPIGRLGLVNGADIAKSVTVNISSNLLMVNKFLEEAYAQGCKASILSISSGAARTPVAGLALYGLGKAAIDYITLSLRAEVMEGNVRASAFYPGGMATDLQRDVQAELKKQSTLSAFDYKRIYDQKLLSPDVVAKVIFDNFLVGENGWEKAISTIHEYS